MSLAPVTGSIERSKADVAKKLAEAHYRIDPSITRIIRLIAPGREGEPAEPVKLLEVNEETITGGIMPIRFGPHPPSGIDFPSIIVEVRPEEFAQIRNGELTLPDGWREGESFSRPGN